MNAAHGMKATRRLMLPFALLLGLVLLIPAGQAKAQTWHHDQLSFGFKGMCLVTTDDGIACTYPKKVRWINLTRNGETEVRSNGGNTIKAHNSVGLFRGTGKWARNGITCIVTGKNPRRAGVKCTNGEHGFWLRANRPLKKF